MLGNSTPETLLKRRKLEKESLSQFTPPNRNILAYRWDLESVHSSFPLQTKVTVESPRFNYLGYDFRLDISFEEYNDHPSGKQYMGCYLKSMENEPNFYGTFDFKFDLVYKSNNQRVDEFDRVDSVGMNSEESSLKNGGDSHWGNCFFYPVELATPEAVSSYYCILVKITQNETLSSFSKSPIDRESEFYRLSMSSVNNKAASTVSFEVDGYIFYASKFMLSFNDYFKALLNHLLNLLVDVRTHKSVRNFLTKCAPVSTTSTVAWALQLLISCS